MINHRPIWAINLKTARKQKKLTQQEVADKIFKSQESYSKYEAGEIEPDMATWYLILEVFEITDMSRFLYQDYHSETKAA